jgi:hypothetical protein
MRINYSFHCIFVNEDETLEGVASAVKETISHAEKRFIEEI